MVLKTPYNTECQDKTERDMNSSVFLFSIYVLFKEFNLIHMLFLIRVTQVPVRIMEHVRLFRVMQLVFVHQSIQD